VKKVKKREYRNRPIVTGYLEKVSSSIFDKHSKIIAEMIKGIPGNSGDAIRNWVPACPAVRRRRLSHFGCQRRGDGPRV
jgi:hypothetical protein